MKSWLFLDTLLPAHRRNQRGQTLVIFAFLAIFMILLLGLVLDTARLFILAAQAERVAEAASLAGALYMPDYFSLAAVTAAGTPTSPDGQYAEDRACKIAQENGIAACPVSPGQIGADVETVPSNQYEIQVTVTLQADVFFLSYVAPGLSSATVSRTAVAQYLPPIQLGSRDYYFGDEIDTDSSGQPLQDFYARLNGPRDAKDHGDAYTPLYQEGPDDAKTTTDATSSIYPIDLWPTTWAPKTNHPQYGLPVIQNPNLDVQPAGFTGHNGKAGYNYEIVVPPGNTTPLEIQIYNPAYAYQVQLDPTTKTIDDMVENCYDTTYHPVGGSCTYDQPGESMQISYTLYSVPLPFERAQDQELATWPAPSLDLNTTDLTNKGCTVGSQAYDPDGLTPGLSGPNCVSLPSYIGYSGGTYTAGWYPMQKQTGTVGGVPVYTTYTFSTPGIYRLALEVTGKYGYHQYAVKVMTHTTGSGSGGVLSTTPPPAGVRLWAWNDMAVYYNKSSATASFDLGEIPAAYAGKTLTFSLFDPGDASNENISLEILDPSGNPITFPSTFTWLHLANGGKDIVASNGGINYYNALWLHLPIPIPATYNPTPGQDWWQIEYIATNVTCTPPATCSPSVGDTVTASITLSGSPIHLVTQVIG
ncbi:MAG TPA: pilus assembly protein TadG-related protein [Ktedonobacterales bacterium]|nr:pilus assembly protein TadG-related protein [Ktedonobacterales bacterium]